MTVGIVTHKENQARHKELMCNWCDMGDMEWINNENFLVKYPDHKLIYLDRNADKYLDEAYHPKDNVLYIVGDDSRGIGKPNKDKAYKIRNLKDKEYFASSIVPFIISERLLKNG